MLFIISFLIFTYLRVKNIYIAKTKGSKKCFVACFLIGVIRIQILSDSICTKCIGFKSQCACQAFRVII